MAVSTISNTITDPSGTAIPNVVINARLKPNGPGYRVSDSSEVATLVSTTTNASGVWSLNLERNANITPGTTYYEIEERIPDSAGGARTWAISVGASNQTVYAALVTTPPSTGSTVYYLTQTAADARYQALGSFGNVGTVNTATYAGIATSAARSDHQHSLAAGIVGTQLGLTAGILSIQNGYRVPANTPAAPASPSGGDLWVTSTATFAVYNSVSTAWYASGHLVPHTMASGVITQATGSIASTTYAVIPVNTAVTFIKQRPDTTLFFDVSMTCFAAGTVTTVQIGVNYDGVAGNTVLCAQLTMNENLSHKTVAGFGKKAGLAAGTYTCALWWAGVANAEFDTNTSDWASLKVTESL